MKTTTMETKTYQFTVEFKPDEDGVIIATVPALPGCHSYGHTMPEAEHNIREALELCVEDMLAHGEEITADEPPQHFPVQKIFTVHPVAV